MFTSAPLDVQVWSASCDNSTSGDDRSKLPDLLYKLSDQLCAVNAYATSRAAYGNGDPVTLIRYVDTYRSKMRLTPHLPRHPQEAVPP
jgi:hypothetical protein